MQDLLRGAQSAFIYIIVCVAAALAIRRLTAIRPEPFRKLLHGIAQGMILCFVWGFERWQSAVIFCGFFIAAGYPALSAVERFDAYARLTNQRRAGEVKNSLVALFAMYAIILTVCWGLLDDRMLAVASVFAWGFGDAAAALIGRKYGRHKIGGGKKSWEGTLSMFAVSAVCVLAVLLVRGGLSVGGCAAAALLTAAASAAVELATPGGYDTITCPVSAMLVLLWMMRVLGG